MVLKARRLVGDFSTQELANAAWASSTAKQRDAPLFTALARTAERRLGDFNRGFAVRGTRRGHFATANQRDAPLFAALARTAERRLGDFNGAFAVRGHGGLNPSRANEAMD